MIARILAACLLASVATAALATSYSDFNAGIAARNRSDWDECIARMTAALAAPDFNPAFRTVAYFDRATAWYGKKDWSKTVADVSESLKLDPDFLDGYGLRAAAYAKLGRLDLAIADASFVIRRKPALVSGYTGRGELYMQQKNYDAAIGDFASVIALMPDSGAGYALRGIAYRAKGDFDHALADSSKMIEINARSPSGYFERGLVYESKGDYAHAQSDFNDAAQRAPADINSRLHLALASWELGRFDDAGKNFAILSAAPKGDLGPYVVLWSYLSAAKAGDKSTDALKTDAAKLERAKWPGPVIDLYLGAQTVDGLMKAAAKGDAGEIAAHGCEANFYAGEWQVLQGNAGGGKVLLTAAANSCAVNFIERETARAELKRL